MYTKSFLVKRLYDIRNKINRILLEQEGAEGISEELADKVGDKIKAQNKKFLDFLYESDLLKHGLVKSILTIGTLPVIITKIESEGLFQLLLGKIAMDDRESFKVFERNELYPLQKIASSLRIEPLLSQLKKLWVDIKDVKKEYKGVESLKDALEKENFLSKTYRYFMSAIGKFKINFPFLSIGMFVLLWTFFTSGILSKDILTFEKIFSSFDGAVKRFFGRFNEIFTDPKAYFVEKAIRTLLAIIFSPFLYFYDYVQSFEFEEYYVPILLTISFVFFILEIVFQVVKALDYV